MATGYVVSGLGDLDVLFRARVSAAGANTGFLSNGGVDLAQRFEPRGATAPIATTNFKVGATDLNQIFKDINAATTQTTTHTLNAATNSGSVGFNLDGFTGANFGSFNNPPTGSFDVCGLIWAGASLLTSHFYLDPTVGTGTAADNDASFSSLEIFGIFADSGGSTATRTLTRGSRNFYGGGGPRNASQWRWDNSPHKFLSGQPYGVTIRRTP